MKKAILITGAAGFIGFHLANALLKKGFLIIGYDNLNDYYDVNLKKARLDILNQFDNFKFRVIYTPGHSSDSVTFYFEKEKVMFTGDFIFKDNIGRCDLPTGSWSSMQKSLKKIKEYSSDITIYPGHGDKTTLKEENNNQYLFTN